MKPKEGEHEPLRRPQSDPLLEPQSAQILILICLKAFVCRHSLFATAVSVELRGHRATIPKELAGHQPQRTGKKQSVNPNGDWIVK